MPCSLVDKEVDILAVLACQWYTFLAEDYQHVSYQTYLAIFLSCRLKSLSVFYQQERDVCAQANDEENERSIRFWLQGHRQNRSRRPKEAIHQLSGHEHR